MGRLREVGVASNIEHISVPKGYKVVEVEEDDDCCCGIFGTSDPVVSNHRSDSNESLSPVNQREPDAFRETLLSFNSSVRSMAKNNSRYMRWVSKQVEFVLLGDQDLMT